MSAIPAPAHSPPEQWPDDEFPLPIGQDLLSYSRNRSSLASQLTWDDSENGSSSAGASPVKGDTARDGQAEEAEGEDWDEELDLPAPALKPFTGSVTRLGSRSPAPVQVMEDDAFDFSDAPPPSALRLKLRIPSVQRADELDWDEDEARGETLKPALPLGLGLRNVPSLPASKADLDMDMDILSPSAEEDDFEAAFALSPEVNFLALPPSDSAHTTPGKDAPGPSAWNITSTTAFSPAPSSIFHASPALSLNTPSTSTAGSSQGDSLSCPGSPVPSASTGPSTHGDSADYLPEQDGAPALPELAALHLQLHDSPTSDDSPEIDGDVLFPAHLTASGMRALLQRRKARAEASSALLSPHSQDDEPFEQGLLIANDDDLSPSRLRAARANASAGRSMIPIAASRQPSAQSSRRAAPMSYLSPPPTQPRTTGSAAALALAHRKSASRLQSPSPSARPAPLPTANASVKPVIRRKASLGTMLPSCGAGGGHTRKKTSGSSSSESIIPIPPVPPLPANLTISPTASLRRPPSAGSSLILSPRSPSPAPSMPATTSSSSNGSHGPSSASRVANPTQSSMAKHRNTQPARRSEPPGLGGPPVVGMVGMVGKKTPPRQRGKLAGLWPGVSPTFSTSSSGSPVTPSPPKPKEKEKEKDPHAQQGPVARLLRRPRGMDKRGLHGGRVWGTGKELDGIEDLPVEKEPEKGKGSSAWGTVRSKGGVSPLPPPTPAQGRQGKGVFALKQAQALKVQTLPQPQAQQKRNTEPPPHQPVVGKPALKELPRPKSRTSPGRMEKENDRRRGPTLIRDLGSVGLPRTQNGMKWNPAKQRWDGQEHLLRVFEPQPARPALITHLTSSTTSPLFKSLGLGGAVGGAMRVVGEMMFDPVEMRWLRRDGAEEEDVFKHVEEESSAGSELAFEHEQQHSLEAGTIRAARAGVLHAPAPPSAAIDPDLVKQCKDAEARHRAELAGWLAGMESVPASPVDEDEEAEKHHRWLWDIRALATQDYGA
ncbi:hypothetical protein CALVIDRAFT_526201 [Calocera viscosa TUFC12733]|uniref:Cytokinesis regulator n=1 Tax=Calocera viscosa (strain TUFC12733) TaxID=1330018 RepID=A0A167P287_CALVF|nr:hypothetical protein CALVIDRAFT_526201 [Calocera viscosa TUFC12733]